MLKALDPPGVLYDLDSGGFQPIPDRVGYVLVLGHENPRSGLYQVDARAERVKDRRHLYAGRAGTDHDHRRRSARKAPGVAVRRGQIEAVDLKPSRHATDADDEPTRPQPRRALASDLIRAIESHDAGVFVDGHAGSLEISQQRVRAHLLDYLPHASE